MEQQASTKPAKIDGTRRMGVSFNPGKDPRIDELKQKFAELHDTVDLYSAQQIANAKDSIDVSEIARACSLALTNLQVAKMFAVEAVTR